MPDIKCQGKIYTYSQLLNEQKVEIPIIQRDYAQGRVDKEELRNNFLGALLNAIENESEIRLDFIYGSTVNDSFQPLDGQQRLTTLFLLHWYAGMKEGIPKEDIVSALGNFSYETRASSKEFCQSLCSNRIEISSEEQQVRELIIDSPWFFLSWKKDPTIDAMLRSIENIHQLFYKTENLWSKLVSDKALISFYYVELEHLGLTDDLYIKMNARGKLLTVFENFKALFQKEVNDNNWDSDKDFPNSFACKIDTEWTDLFWSHRKENRIDDAFIRFISFVAMVRQTIERRDDRIKVIRDLQGKPDLVRVGMFTKEGYEYLYNILEIYSSVISQEDDLSFNFPLWQHKPETDLFSALVYEGKLNDASYTQKVLFYAQTEYLLKCKEFEIEYFRDWMRVIRNIISRGDVTKAGKRPPIIRSPEAFDGVVNLISELSEGCSNIYKFLSENKPKSTYSREQIEEERLKANLIEQDNSLKQTIFEAEDTNFCQGRIGFVLHCINYKNCEDIFNKDLLNDITKVLQEYLEEDIDNDFRRGLLLTPDSEGKYKFYEYWWSWSHVVDAEKRCLIENYRELEYFIYGRYKYQEYFKDYLKNLLLMLVEKDIVSLINEFEPPSEMPNWKVRLIKEPNLLNDKCPSHYIAIPNDQSCCYLLKSKRPRDMYGLEKIK